MSIDKKKKRKKLSHEILGIFLITAVIFIFIFFCLSTAAYSIATTYCEANNIILSDMLEWTINVWTQNVSFAASLLIFVALLLFLIGRKIAYIKEIILGVDALRTHRMNYKIPLDGNNELTELAESINFLSKTELELKEKEETLQKEKEEFIRSLSHDIRTPLTSILSYSEYINSKESLTKDEIKDYTSLIQKKALQIKTLSDQLLEGKNRSTEYFENGKFLFEQLVEEWAITLEDIFKCEIDFSNCHPFSGNFNVPELQRIFDNLASNIKKYADPEDYVTLKIYTIGKQLFIEQKNICKNNKNSVESNKIGLENIKKICMHYNGELHYNLEDNKFSVRIIFSNLI